MKEKEGETDKKQEEQNPADLIRSLMMKIKDGDHDMGVNQTDEQIRADCQRLASLLAKNGQSPGQGGQGQNSTSLAPPKVQDPAPAETLNAHRQFGAGKSKGKWHPSAEGKGKGYKAKGKGGKKMMEGKYGRGK